MTNCWNEDPKHRPTFTAIVQKIDPLLASLAGYCDFNVTISQESLSPEFEDANAEPSVNIEAVSDAPVTNHSAISCNEDPEASLPSGIDAHINTDTSAKSEISVRDEDIFKNDVPASNEGTAVSCRESFITNKPYTSGEASVTREAEMADDIDMESYV